MRACDRLGRGTDARSSPPLPLPLPLSLPLPWPGLAAGGAANSARRSCRHGTGTSAVSSHHRSGPRAVHQETSADGHGPVVSPTPVVSLALGSAAVERAAQTVATDSARRPTSPARNTTRRASLRQAKADKTQAPIGAGTRDSPKVCNAQCCADRARGLRHKVSPSHTRSRRLRTSDAVTISRTQFRRFGASTWPAHTRA